MVGVKHRHSEACEKRGSDVSVLNVKDVRGFHPPRWVPQEHRGLWRGALLSAMNHGRRACKAIRMANEVIEFKLDPFGYSWRRRRR